MRGGHPATKRPLRGSRLLPRLSLPNPARRSVPLAGPHIPCPAHLRRPPSRSTVSQHPSRGSRAWPPRVWPRPGPSPLPDACFLVHKKTVAGPLPCCWARAGRRGRKFLELQTPPSEGRGSGLGSAAASPGKEVLGPAAPPLAQLARHRKLPPPAPHLGPGSPRRSEPSYPPEVAWLRMAEPGRPSEARFPADPAESQRTSDLPQRASGRWLPARLRGPRRPLCLPEPPRSHFLL